MKRYHVCVRGDVQQVGFRWYARRTAEETGVCGWVRNLADGSVEITAEGKEADLEMFLQKLNSGYLGKNISEISKSDQSYTGEFNSFTIVL